MTVREGMTPITLTVGPQHSLRYAATKMYERKVGSAVVHNPDGAGHGILTERDVLRALGEGCDPDHALVGDYMSDDLIVASPEWDLGKAAETMIRSNFRHLLVIDGGEIVGVLSMRDIVRVWSARSTASATA